MQDISCCSTCCYAIVLLLLHIFIIFIMTMLSMVLAFPMPIASTTNSTLKLFTKEIYANACAIPSIAVVVAMATWALSSLLPSTWS